MFNFSHCFKSVFIIDRFVISQYQVREKCHFTLVKLSIYDNGISLY